MVEEQQKSGTRTSVLGKAYGAVITLIALVLLAQSMFSASDRELIGAWRSVRVGMTVNQVQAELGEPSYSFEAGEGFSGWAQQGVPDGYDQDHGLLVYRMGFPGPQLLLIYLDAEGQVVFVSSAVT